MGVQSGMQASAVIDSDDGYTGEERRTIKQPSPGEVHPCGLHSKMPQIIQGLIDTSSALQASQTSSTAWLLRMTKIYMIILGLMVTVGFGYVGGLTVRYMSDMQVRDQVRREIISNVDALKGHLGKIDALLVRMDARDVELTTLMTEHIRKWDSVREDELRALRDKRGEKTPPIQRYRRDEVYNE